MTLFVEELPQVSTPTDSTKVEYIELDWEERRRPRRRLTTPKGTELALALKRGTVLSDGDVLYSDNEKTIVVRSKAQEVVCVQPADFNQATRVSHFLGNWHRSIQTTEDGFLLTELDAPLEEWLKKERIAYSVQNRPYHPNLKGSDHD